MAASLWHLDAVFDQHSTVIPLHAELKGGSFKACRFARDGRLGLFTVVNHQGRGHILYWSQSELGELTLDSQTKASCFSAPITAFEISAKGNFLGTGTSEGMHLVLRDMSQGALHAGSVIISSGNSDVHKISCAVESIVTRDGTAVMQ